MEIKQNKPLAARFGFGSDAELRQYLKICHSNPEWAKTYGANGFLSNQFHIYEFQENITDFRHKVAQHRAISLISCVEGKNPFSNS